MKPHRKKKLLAIVGGVLALSVAVGLILYASGQKMNLFYTPSEIAQGKAPLDQIIRVGGLVKMGTVEHVDRDDSVLETRFVVTDKAMDINVTFDRVLPDLFREGQGVVALGRIDEQGVFVATEVLAKHDEEYKAPEVLDALERAGHPVKKDD
ncbi:cytochrome c maturation protein CcmE [Aliikangiella marina]|uniref:Cytochrome c-type biogenesis protein CcmE n=2 Tax=Aliikangiella marina TaxID=1712262 RepID=A0A545T3B2_9GAMM|nr:cytochrome c maturation protein CcmE [Aliikangiella marina]